MQQKEITWKTNFFTIFICLCFFIFIASCSDEKDGIPDFDPETSNTTPGGISKSLVARIYFDATLSMQGFVVPDATAYTRICPYLESIVKIGWENEKVNFFRFGEKVESIDRSIYLQAGYKTFYEKEHIYRETFIEKVIDYEKKLGEDGTVNGNTSKDAPEGVISEKATENSLVVIVTDLFQAEGDINRLVNKLKREYINKEQYIKNEIDVGLFGLRSQFKGTVYDTGIGQAPMPYESDPKDPETFRPFYLLVLGKHADIARYFDRIKENGFPEAQTVIFSRYLVNPLLSFDGEEEIIKTDNLNRRIINPKHSQTARLKQYEIVDNSKPAAISVKMEYKPLPHAMFFYSDIFETSIIAKCKDDEETTIRRAEACLEVKPTLSKNNDSNELNIEFSLNSQSLPRKTVYLYEVTLSPNMDTFQAPEWCSDWDMGDERNGAKTLNLVNFVRDLSLVTAQMHRPQIAKFHCYIKKR